MSQEETRELEELLRRRKGGDPAAIDAEISSKFETEYAVVISDLSSFSKLTQEKGIVHAMGLIVEAHTIAEPILSTLGGEVLRADPESLVVLFQSSMDAVMAARAVNRAFEDHNAETPDENKLAICLGIGFGKMIRAGDHIYGDQINQAYRIGEDVSGHCEVHLTPEAYEGVKHLGSLEFTESSPIQLGELTLNSYSLVFT